MSIIKPLTVVNGVVIEHNSNDVEFDAFKYVDATTGGTNCLFIGNTGNTTNTGASNLFAGNNAGKAVTTGSFNFALGTDSLFTATTSSDSVAIGDSALKNFTASTGETVAIGSDAAASQTGIKSVSIGYRAGNTNGGFSVFIGHDAGQSSTASQTVGIGANALLNSTSTAATAVGYEAAKTATSAQTTAIGYQAAFNTTTGGLNAFVGHQAGYSNSTGLAQVTIGHQAGYSLTNSRYNSFVGYRTGYTTSSSWYNSYYGGESGRLSTGEKNCFFGYKAGENSGAAGSCVFLGYNAGQNESNSNRLYIAHTNTTTPLIYGEFDSELIKINGDFYTEQGRYKNQTRTTSASYAVVNSDEEIMGNTDANAVAINLQAGVAKRHLRIINTGTSGNDITVNPNGAENLLGVNSGFVLSDGETLVISYNTTDGWY